MKLRECIKRILIFSLAFILGVSLTKTVQFQENKTFEMYSLIESIQVPQIESKSDSELTALKEKLDNLQKNRCEISCCECGFSLSFYEAQYYLEIDQIETQIDLIKAKNERFTKKIHHLESKLRDIESALRKFKGRLEKFEKDVRDGRIDRSPYNRALIYFEKCIQK
jgi:peptidoglycan hydrolase CwlO-like protein